LPFPPRLPSISPFLLKPIPQARLSSPRQCPLVLFLSSELPPGMVFENRRTWPPQRFQPLAFFLSVSPYVPLFSDAFSCPLRHGFACWKTDPRFRNIFFCLVVTVKLPLCRSFFFSSFFRYQFLLAVHLSTRLDQTWRIYLPWFALRKMLSQTSPMFEFHSYEFSSLSIDGLSCRVVHTLQLLSVIRHSLNSSSLLLLDEIPSLFV